MNTKQRTELFTTELAVSIDMTSAFPEDTKIYMQSPDFECSFSFNGNLIHGELQKNGETHRFETFHTSSNTSSISGKNIDCGGKIIVENGDVSS